MADVFRTGFENLVVNTTVKISLWPEQLHPIISKKVTDPQVSSLLIFLLTSELIICDVIMDVNIADIDLPIDIT